LSEIGKLALFYMNSILRIRFRLDISSTQYLAVYKGLAKNVIVKADDGKMVAFPAGNIQQYLNQTGIHGYFEMEMTSENKFLTIKKIA
jgi:hypothetical protein